MKVNVYVDWANKRIMSEDDAVAFIGARADDYIHDEITFADWLFDNYTITEVWWMSDEARDKAEKEFKDFCYRMAGDDLEHTCEVREIEI